MTDISFDTCTCGSVVVSNAQSVAELKADNEHLRVALGEAIEFADQDYHVLTPTGEAMIARWRAALNGERMGGTVMRTLLEEAITDHFGERCPDFEPGCPCCRAWAEFDEIKRLRAALEDVIVCSDYDTAVAVARDALGGDK